MAVMLSSLCRIRGSSSTPTLMDLAVRNGDLLNLGSSAMDKLSAAREPEKSERLRLRTSTLRPSAAEAFSSMVGRDKERRDEDENDQDDNDDEYDAKCTAHEQPPARQGRQRERERVVVRGILA